MDKGSGEARSARHRLIRAGYILFAKEGFAGTSLRRASALAGVTPGSLQYHFGSKRGFYEAVTTESFTALAWAWRRTVDGSPGRHTRCSRVTALVDHLWVNPNTARLLLRDALRGGAGSGSFHHLADELAADVSAEAGGLGAPVVRVWALDVLLMAAVSALVHSVLPAVAREEVVEALTRLPGLVEQPTDRAGSPVA